MLDAAEHSDEADQLLVLRFEPVPAGPDGALQIGDAGADRADAEALRPDAPVVEAVERVAELGLDVLQGAGGHVGHGRAQAVVAHVVVGQVRRAHADDPGPPRRHALLRELDAAFQVHLRVVDLQLVNPGIPLCDDGTQDGALVDLRVSFFNGGGVLRLDSITGSFGVFRKAFDIAGLNIDAVLDALERKGLVKTLANPTLVALSGETASFLAGGEFPVPVAQSNGGGGGGGGNGGSISVEFKPFGVSLAFTPTVLADGVINLAVEPEVSSIDPSASISVNGLVIPGLQTRRANTVLELRDGESFALAGLIRKDFQTTVRQVPLLGSIPIIGSLFRSSGFQKGETELVIVVTPRLVQPIKAGAPVALTTDRVQNPHELDLFLMGRTDKAVGVNPLDPNAPPPEAAKKEGADYDY